jgi:hypothetical protein
VIDEEWAALAANTFRRKLSCVRRRGSTHQSAGVRLNRTAITASKHLLSACWRRLILLRQHDGDHPLGDSNLRIPESKFAKTPAWGGGIRTSASGNLRPAGRPSSQGPLLRRHYPASTLLRPCWIPVMAAAWRVGIRIVTFEAC